MEAWQNICYSLRFWPMNGHKENGSIQKYIWKKLSSIFTSEMNVQTQTSDPLRLKCTFLFTHLSIQFIVDFASVTLISSTSNWCISFLLSFFSGRAVHSIVSAKPFSFLFFRLPSLWWSNCLISTCIIHIYTFLRTYDAWIHFAIGSDQKFILLSK